MPPSDDNEVLSQGPCPHEGCGSSDAYTVYSNNGGTYCFSCGVSERDDTSSDSGGVRSGVDRRVRGARASGDLVPLEEQTFTGIPPRCLAQATCEKWQYGRSTYRGSKVHVANYFRDGQLVAQKIRKPGKHFTMLGDGKGAPLYGQWLFRDGGRRLVIVEGEIDALSMSQLQDLKWPVVSLPNGAAGAVKSIKRELEWVEQFNEVVLMFDMDEPGQTAAKQVADLLTPGKAKIASLPCKDVSACLQEGKGKDVISAMWEAKTSRPDGIVDGTDMWSEITRRVESACVDLPWDGLQEKLMGLRRGELVTITAGSGIGKSAVCRELAHYLLTLGETIGYIALEESTKRTSLGLMGIELNRPVHLDMRSHDELSEDEQKDRRVAFEQTVGSGRVYLYDHFGSVDIDNMLSRVRYLAVGCDCRWVFLDHLSIMVSGLETGDERRGIDIVMTKLRSLVEETGIGLILVSHLKRPTGDKGHEDGASTHLSQLRGSASIAQLSDAVIGLERDQQAEVNPNLSQLRVLKNRHAGLTGPAGYLLYRADTGRLAEVDPEFVNEKQEDASDGF